MNTEDPMDDAHTCKYCGKPYYPDVGFGFHGCDEQYESWAAAGNILAREESFTPPKPREQPLKPFLQITYQVTPGIPENILQTLVEHLEENTPFASNAKVKTQYKDKIFKLERIVTPVPTIL